MHLVPELIQSIVKDLHSAKPDHAGTYEKRLESIRSYIDIELKKHYDKKSDRRAMSTIRDIFRK
jgi:hypothetical protein